MGAAPGRQRAAGPRAGGGRWARRSPRPPGRRPSARPRVCAPRPGGPRGGGSRRAASRRALGAAAADGAGPGRAGSRRGRGGGAGRGCGAPCPGGRRTKRGGGHGSSGQSRRPVHLPAPSARAQMQRLLWTRGRCGCARWLAGNCSAGLCFFHREPPVSPVSVLFPYCYGFGVWRLGSVTGAARVVTPLCTGRNSDRRTLAVRNRSRELLKRGVGADTMQKASLLLVEPYITQQNESHDSAGCEPLP